MQGILARRHYLLAALLVLLLSVTLAACDTNGLNGSNGTDGTAAPNGEEGINAESQGDSDEEPFEIQKVPGSDDGTTSGTDDGDAVAQSPEATVEGEATPGGEAAGTVTAQEGTPTAAATSQAGQDGDAQMIADCFETDPHPIGEAIADDFDASYDEVMGWMCEGSSFEDILLALQTSEVTGRPAGEILDETGSRSWSVIWQEGGLLSSGPDGDADDTPDMMTTPTPGAQDDDTTGSDDSATTPAPGAQATPGAGTDGDDDSDTSMGEQDGEGQLVFEDGAMQWTDDEFELTGVVVAKDEASRTIDVRARNEDDDNQIYAFAVGENGIFDEVQEGDRVRVTGERLDDGTVVAYAMELVAKGTGGTDGQDGDAQDDMSLSAGVSTLAPGEIEFRGTIVATDPDERSFELQLAQAGTGLDVQDDTFTSPLTPTSPATGTDSDDLDDSDVVTSTGDLDDSDVVTGTNGPDDADDDDLDQVGRQQTYTFYVPESLSFDAFGLGDVIEVEIEPLDAGGLNGDQDAMDDITGTNDITGTDDIVDTEPLTGTGTMTDTDSLDLSDDDSATGDDSDLAGDDDSATGDDSGPDLGGIVEDLLNGDDQATEPWRMVEFELTGTVAAVDEAAGTIDVRVLYDGGQEETYTFAVSDDDNLSLYREGGSVEIEVQLEATAAEIGQREALNGDLGDSDDDADDVDATDSMFAQQPLGLGAGEFEFRGTIVSVDEAANSFDLRPDARYTQDMDQDMDQTGTDIITGTDGLDDTDSMTGTNGLDDTDGITGTDGLDDTDSITGTNGLDDDSDSMTGTNGTAGQGQLDLYTFVLPQGADVASFSEGDVVEVEIEPVPTGGLFGLDGQDDLDLGDDDQDDVDLSDDQGDVDLSDDDQDDTDASQDDAGTSASPLGGDDDQDDRAQDGQDGMAQLDAATMMTSIELRGEVVAVDDEAGTIDVRLTPMDDMTGTNGLVDDDSSGLAPTDGMTATETVTGTDDLDDSDADDGDLDDSDADDSDLSPLGQTDGEEILTFYIADAAARRYYQPGTLVEIEIDLEERADMDGDADASAGGQFCATATGEHPLADAIAMTYGAGVDEVRGWYCEDNLGFGEIMLALTTADVSGERVEDLAGRRVDNESWGEIWQDLGLITRIEDAGEMDDRLSDD